MKQKDIALIIIVVFFSGVISVFVSKSLIVPPENREQQVEKVQAITTDFKLPDKQFFNNDSINPTQLITIGDNANPDPFSKKTQ